MSTVWAINVIYSREIGEKVQYMYEIEKDISESCAYTKGTISYDGKPETKWLKVVYDIDDNIETVCQKVYKFVDSSGWENDKVHKTYGKNLTILHAKKDGYEIDASISDVNEKRRLIVIITYRVKLKSLNKN